MKVRLKCDLFDITNMQFRQGDQLTIHREFEVTTPAGWGQSQRQRRYALADQSGRIVLPCVRPEDCELIP